MAVANREAFAVLADRLEAGDPLTFEGLGNVFGNDLWIMLLYTVLDAQDAARVIQGSLMAVKAEARRRQEEAAQAAEPQ